MIVRPLSPDDFLPALQRVDQWFGETVHEPVHPVFFHHFGGYAVKEGDDLIGFLMGFRSQRNRDIAYIHLAAIHPDRRGEGIGSNLYDRFERQAHAWGCAWIEAVAATENMAALDFHESKGFWKELVKDWAGPGQDRWVLRKRIAPPVV
jgi:GNAT superfamily N-acetyltransferase